MSLSSSVGPSANASSRGAELTIVIPTYNRPRYLRRALKFWSESGYGIIVADGSASRYPGDLPPNVRYFHDTQASLAKRWFDAVNLVETPYVALCGEDDFLSLHGVRQCLDFLRNNDDYVSAQGHAIEFTVDGKDNITIAVFNEPRIGRNIDAETPSERMSQLFGEYIFQVFSVYRTSMWRHVLSATKERKNMNYIELGSAIIPAIFGKHRVLPVFYYARENVPQSATSTTEAPRFDVLTPEGLADYTEWRNSVAAILADVDNISQVEAATIVDRTFAEYNNWDQRTFPSRRALRGNSKLPFRYRIRKLVPAPLLKLRRFLREKTGVRHRAPGYPWSDYTARQEWTAMVAMINEHLI